LILDDCGADLYRGTSSPGQSIALTGPLGYRAQDRKLVIVDSEAEIVRSISQHTRAPPPPSHR
jgi:thiamine monophosphate kinase